jgi:hypothetical protein
MKYENPVAGRMMRRPGGGELDIVQLGGKLEFRDFGALTGRRETVGLSVAAGGDLGGRAG